MKSLDNENIDSANSLDLIFNNVDGYMDILNAITLKKVMKINT